MGLSRYGEREGVARLTAALFETAAEMEMRLPELFCGFPRSAGEPPVAYPVACLPQAWAAGSVFMLLQACLGVAAKGEAGGVEITDPRLPIGIDRLLVAGLDLGGQYLTLRFERSGGVVQFTREALLSRADAL
jgi:glycogen debranching enzyme